jgi:hypothetical protein
MHPGRVSSDRSFFLTQCHFYSLYSMSFHPEIENFWIKAWLSAGEVKVAVEAAGSGGSFDARSEIRTSIKRVIEKGVIDDGSGVI